MQMIMQEMRKTPLKRIAGRNVIEAKDYLTGINKLPKSDVLKYVLEKSTSVAIRPSGTEPKLKIYLSISAESSEAAEKIESFIVKELEVLFN